jgi:hypothetical protein
MRKINKRFAAAQVRINGLNRELDREFRREFNREFDRAFGS